MMRNSLFGVVTALVLASVVHAAEEPLDLQALLAEAGRSNPEVSARIARAEAAAELPSERGALPDPMLSGSYTNDGLSEFTLGSSQFSNVTARWDQTVPARAVRSSASAVAEAETGVLRASTETFKAELRARVIALFGAIWRADRTRELLMDGRVLLETARDAARVRYEAGEGIQERILRAENEIRRVDLELSAVARERRGAGIALGAALGRSVDVSFGPAGALPDVSLPVDPVELERSASASSPGLLEARAAQTRAAAATDNARAQNRAEWGWMAAYQYLGGLDPMVMGGFTVRLPIWKDRKQAHAIASAEREQEATQRERDGADIAARAAVRDLTSEISTIDGQLAIYDGAILPQDLATLDSARAAFSAGRAEMTLVIDDVGRLLADRRAEVDLHYRRLVAFSGLENASGLVLVAPAGSGEVR